LDVLSPRKVAAKCIIFDEIIEIGACDSSSSTKMFREICKMWEGLMSPGILYCQTEKSGEGAFWNTISASLPYNHMGRYSVAKRDENLTGLSKFKIWGA
jgi:hypothetical protein